MSNIKIITKKQKINDFRRRINEHYDNYYDIRVTDEDYIQKFYNSYLDLLEIRKDIGNYFGILDSLPNLYSRTLISTRLSIIKEEKQYQNEIKYKLEQLRALDNDININVSLASNASIGIDTKEDFMAIKKIMEYKS